MKRMILHVALALLLINSTGFANDPTEDPIHSNCANHAFRWVVDSSNDDYWALVNNFVSA